MQDTLAEIEAEVKKGLSGLGQASSTSPALPHIVSLQCVVVYRGQSGDPGPGLAQVQDTLAEIEERGEAVRELEKSLLDLHQIFLDMAVLVEAQGEMLDNIEAQVRAIITEGGMTRSCSPGERQGGYTKCPARCDGAWLTSWPGRERLPQHSPDNFLHAALVILHQFSKCVRLFGRRACARIGPALVGVLSGVMKG